MTRKYRVLIVGDDTNPAGRHGGSYYAEYEVPDGVTDADAFERYVTPAVMAAWIGYRNQETMAEAVNEASK